MGRLTRTMVVAAVLCLVAQGLALCGTYIRLSDIVVTAAFPGFFYIEEADRTAGIRVEKDGVSVAPGDLVDILGRVGKDPSGERCIVADTVTVKGQTSPPRPMAMKNESLGGWSWRWTRGSDGKPVEKWMELPSFTRGLLVKVWGRVTQVDPSGQWMCIDDGSHLTNYAKTRTGVRVLLLSGPALNQVGDFVVVTGVNAALADETTQDPLPQVIPRSVADIQKY